MIPLVVVESPFAGDVEANLAFAHRAIGDCLDRGESPIASHVTLTTALRDAVPEERERGIEAGLAWLRVATLSAIYIDRGVSSGMRRGFVRALSLGVRVEVRALGWVPRRERDLALAELGVSAVEAGIMFHAETVVDDERPFAGTIAIFTRRR